MKSFDLHFDKDGNVKVDNIQGVVGNECLGLTADYIAKFGVVQESLYIGSNEFEATDQNLDERI